MKGESSHRLRPELLAAYLDGELEGAGPQAALRQQVEDWLSRHSEAASEVRAHRQLQQIWQATSPPEPRRGAWAEVRGRIRRALDQPRPQPRFHWRPWLLGGSLAGFTGLAASLLVLVWLGALPWPQPRPSRPTPAVDELVFPVASAHEIEILSVTGDDIGTLVVGEPPVDGPLVLLAPGEVSLTRVHSSGQDDEGEVSLEVARNPMIWFWREGDEE